MTRHCEARKVSVDRSRAGRLSFREDSPLFARVPLFFDGGETRLHFRYQVPEEALPLVAAWEAFMGMTLPGETAPGVL